MYENYLIIEGDQNLLTSIWLIFMQRCSNYYQDENKVIRGKMLYHVKYKVIWMKFLSLHKMIMIKQNENTISIHVQYASAYSTSLL